MVLTTTILFTVRFITLRSFYSAVYPLWPRRIFTMLSAPLTEIRNWPTVLYGAGVRLYTPCLYIESRCPGALIITPNERQFGTHWWKKIRGTVRYGYFTHVLKSFPLCYRWEKTLLSRTVLNSPNFPRTAEKKCGIVEQERNFT